MLAKRIVPCLDIKDGRTVKGVNFEGLIDAGDPIALAKAYADQGADELVFLDITATEQRRETLYDLVEKVAEAIDIPFTVGGGVSNITIAERLMESGADKISVNSAAFKNPQLINDLAQRFGKQSIVVAIDAKLVDGNWSVHLMGGKKKTSVDLFDWALEAQERGAGEILFTSMNQDGTQAGFANEALKKLNSILTIPVIASGGAGTVEDFLDTFRDANSDAALAASVFHFDKIKIQDLKVYLKQNQIPIRL